MPLQVTGACYGPLRGASSGNKLFGADILKPAFPEITDMPGNSCLFPVSEFQLGGGSLGSVGLRQCQRSVRPRIPPSAR